MDLYIFLKRERGVGGVELVSPVFSDRTGGSDEWFFEWFKDVPGEVQPVC